MAVYLCAGEHEDWNQTSVVLPTYNTVSKFRAGYARTSLEFAGGVWAAASTWVALDGTTTRWLTFRWYIDKTATTGIVVALAKVAGAYTTTTNRLGIGITVAGGLAYPTLISATGGVETVFATSAIGLGSTAPGGAPHKFDLYIEGYAANKNVKLYVDGVLHIDYALKAPDVTDTSVNYLAIVGPANAQAFSEIVLADADTRTFSLVTLTPNGAGGVRVRIASGTYEDVDEIVADDLTYIETLNATTTAKIQLACTNLPATTLTVEAVQVSARVDTNLNPVFGGANDPGYYAGVGAGAPTTEWYYAAFPNLVNGQYAVKGLFWGSAAHAFTPFTPEEVDNMQIGVSFSLEA